MIISQANHLQRLTNKIKNFFHRVEGRVVKAPQQRHHEKVIFILWTTADVFVYRYAMVHKILQSFRCRQKLTGRYLPDPATNSFDGHSVPVGDSDSIYDVELLVYAFWLQTCAKDNLPAHHMVA